jgi:hypothetical protein
MSIDWNLRQIMFQPILLKIQGKPKTQSWQRQVLKSFRKKTRKEKIKRLLEK